MTDPGRLPFGTHVTVAEMATVCLKESFAELLSCWEAAADHGLDDPEHVHELRVATRRAAVVLRLFADYLPKRQRKKLLRRVDAVRKSAGPARDCDVFAALLARGLPATPEVDQEVRERVAGQFAERLQRQRAAAQQELLACYEQFERGEKLERAVTKLLGSLQPRGKRAVREANSFPHWAAKRLRRASRDFFDQANVDPDNFHQLHRFRIRAKQLRYRHEWLQPAFPSDHFEGPYSSLKKLCQRLGEINDHVTARAILARWLSTPFDSEATHLLRGWRAAERRELQRALSNFDDWWSGRRRRRLRQQLDETSQSVRTVRQPR